MNKLADYTHKGHFALSSGLHSDTYFQLAGLLENGLALQKIAEELVYKLPNEAEYDVVVSPAMGGLFIGYEVAKQLAVPFVFTERVDGKMKLRRDFTVKQDAKVLIVEDVVTTGSSAIQVLGLLTGYGVPFQPMKIKTWDLACIVNRGGPHVPYFDKTISWMESDEKSWPAEECPLCAEKLALSRPGSNI